MQQGSTTTDIITAFETYLDDATELSTPSELALMNKIYQEVNMNRPWEFRKSSSSGVIQSDASGNLFVALPADFAEFSINNLRTNNTEEVNTNAQAVAIFVGGQLSPIQIINYSDRQSYYANANYAYLDMKNNRISFTGLNANGNALNTALLYAGNTFQFDYLCIPPDLDLAGSNPVWPVRFWDMIYHKAACDDQIIQLQDRAHSYAAENQQRYLDYLQLMTYWNSRLIQN
jgi:hypothetical protein